MGVVEGRRTAEVEGGPRFWVRALSSSSPIFRNLRLFASITNRFYHSASCRAAVSCPGRYIHIECTLTHRFSVVLISNQYLKSSGLAEWKKKIPLIAAAV